MEKLSILATPRHIVTAVALGPTFILLIADIIGWALRRILWGGQLDLGRDRKSREQRPCALKPSFQTQTAASSRVAAARVCTGQNVICSAG